MFLIVDSSPRAEVEACRECRTLIEVGPPPMSQAGILIAQPMSMFPCRHMLKPVEADLSDNRELEQNCA